MGGDRNKTNEGTGEGRSADTRYQEFAKSNQVWHERVEKSIKKIDKATKTSRRTSSRP